MAKVRADTGAVVYATYLGGDTNEAGTGIAVDAAGNVYVTGTTGGDFPTTSHAVVRTGNYGVFAAKLSPDGSHFLYSTYLPFTVPASSETDPATAGPAPPAIAVDSQGHAYITGQSAEGHAFVVKLSKDGSVMVYRTVLRGSTGRDAGTAIAADAAGNAYITGMTTSPDFHTSPGAFQTRLAGQANAFVAKLDSSGNILFATYLGGTGSDQGIAVQVDSAGSAYIAGNTTSLDFPTTAASYAPKAVVPMWGFSPGGFAAKLSPSGDALVYSSYVYGGDVEGDSAVRNMILDSAGGSYLAGVSGPGMPVTATAPQPCMAAADSSVVVTHLDPHGALVDRTYFGASAGVPFGLALSGDRSVLLGSFLGNVGPVLAQLNFGNAQTPAPPCLSPNVFNAASLTPGLAPGEVISLIGLGIGPAEGVPFKPGPGGAAPLQLAGVQVLFDNQLVPLLYVQSQQINAFAPFELASRAMTNVQVVYNGAIIGSFVEPVGIATPGLTFEQIPQLFRLSPGLSTQAAAINEDGTINGPTHPAPVGSVISLYGTGFGQTQLPGVTGRLFPNETSSLVTPAAVYIGGILPPIVFTGTSAEVLYAGAAPGEFAGIDQINVRVPMPSTGTGDEVQIRVVSVLNDGSSRSFGLVGTTISVR